MPPLFLLPLQYKQMIRIGIDSIDLDPAASAIGQALKVEFQQRESSFRGGDYCRAEVREGSLIIQRNSDALDEEPFEASWPADKLVLYLDGLSDDAWQPYVRILCTFHDPETRVLDADKSP
jgi:hypothetical protein